jgi:hypothetical protein
LVSLSKASSLPALLTLSSPLTKSVFVDSV